MAWEGSTRRSRLPSDWALRRVRVLRRDGYRCQAKDEIGVRCGAPANEVDHIVPGDDHRYENLQALCRFHHGQKTAKEAAAARKPREKRVRRPERHPGLVDE